MWMGTRVGVGIEGEESLCCVQSDVKDGWCFSCTVSFLTVSLINGTRGLLLSLVLLPIPQEGTFTLCFSLSHFGHNSA